VVFFFSDFLAQNYRNHFKAVARRYDLIAVPFSDPAEQSLPNAGLIELRDPETGVTRLLDTSSKQLREHFIALSKKRIESLRSFFIGCGIDVIEVSTDKDYVEAIVRFFKKRERRMAA